MTPALHTASSTLPFRELDLQTRLNLPLGELMAVRTRSLKKYLEALTGNREVSETNIYKLYMLIIYFSAWHWRRVLSMIILCYKTKLLNCFANKSYLINCFLFRKFVVFTTIHEYNMHLQKGSL